MLEKDLWKGTPAPLLRPLETRSPVSPLSNSSLWTLASAGRNRGLRAYLGFDVSKSRLIQLISTHEKSPNSTRDTGALLEQTEALFSFVFILLWIKV